MKKLLIGFLTFASVSSFAAAPFMVSYGPIKGQLKDYNFKAMVDSRIPLGGSEVKMAERCMNILDELCEEQSGLHGFLLLNAVGDSNGICLIKTSLNY